MSGLSQSLLDFFPRPHAISLVPTNRLEQTTNNNITELISLTCKYIAKINN